MKGERKLRLIPGGKAPDAPAEEPPFSAEEMAEAAALRERIDLGEEPLFAELKVAHVPGPIGETDLDAILARAMGDEAATTAAERAAGEALRAQLEGEAPAREGAELLVALRNAAKPAAISPARNEELIESAFRRAVRRGGAVRRIAPVTMAALAGIAALAAGFSMLIDRDSMVPVRSAQELFDPATPFPRHGGESARIDRIAAARGAEMRQNRFKSWGVR